MNSLQIYKIKDIQDIITDYKKQFEYIDQLEYELDYGSVDFEFSYDFDKVRFQIDIRKGITNVYINGKLKCEEWVFQDYFHKQSEYIKEAILHFVSEKLFNRYKILPFDTTDYYENVDALLYNIFCNDMDDNFKGILERTEEILIDEFFSCQLRHQELDRDVIIYEDNDNIYSNLESRKFLEELEEYLDNERPFIIINNLTEIINFFDNIKNNDY